MDLTDRSLFEVGGTYRVVLADRVILPFMYTADQLLMDIDSPADVDKHGHAVLYSGAIDASNKAVWRYVERGQSSTQRRGRTAQHPVIKIMWKQE